MIFWHSKCINVSKGSTEKLHYRLAVKILKIRVSEKGFTSKLKIRVKGIRSYIKLTNVFFIVILGNQWIEIKVQQ